MLVQSHRERKLMDDNRCRASDLVSAASEDIGYNNYDEFAYGYASDNEKTPFNTLYEREC